MTHKPQIKFYDRIVQQKEPPENKHVLWSDITDIAHPVLKVCIDDDWVPYNRDGGGGGGGAVANIDRIIAILNGINHEMLIQGNIGMINLGNTLTVQLPDFDSANISQIPYQNRIPDAIYITNDNKSYYCTKDKGFISMFTLPNIPQQVQPDWDENDTSAPGYIQHKPKGKIYEMNVDNNKLIYTTTAYELKSSYS